jgi:hypothetical protein
MKPVKSCQFGLKVPVALRDKARAKANKTGVPLSYIIRQLLKGWVENNA